MRQELLGHQYNYRRDPSAHAEDELAIIILKPGFTDEHHEKVTIFCAQNNLELVRHNDFQFDPTSTLALYNDIFRFSENDIRFGYDWKARKLAYMTSGPSRIYIVRGKDARPLSEAFKYELRDTYGKLSVPDRALNNDEFEELAIKNIVHVVDGADIEVALWLLA